MIYVGVFMTGFITALLTCYGVFMFVINLFSSGGNE